MEASGGGETLLTGSSFLRGLVVIIALTWVPFPIWYALSPEGFNIIKDPAGMKVAVAFLNVFSKGSFMMYLARIRTDHNTRQKTLVAVGYIEDMDVLMNNDDILALTKEYCTEIDLPWGLILALKSKIR